MSEFENAFAHVQAGGLPVAVSQTGYRSLLELASKGSDGELVGFMRSLVRAAIDSGLRVEEVQLVEQAGPSLAVHLLPAALAKGEARAEPGGEPLLLFLNPGPEASDAQVACLAEQLGLQLPDARQAARCSVPQVLLKGTDSELKARAAALNDAQLPLGCVGLGELLGALEPWLVEWIDVEEDGLYLNGPRGRVPLRLTERALLVRGTYAYFPSALSLGAGTAAARRGASAAMPRIQRTPFAHLYLEGSPIPFSFVASELRDYAFLREDMAPSASANFRALLGILGSAPQVTVNAVLEEVQPALVQRATRNLWLDLQPPESSSPDLDAEVLSRLIYFSTF